MAEREQIKLIRYRRGYPGQLDDKRCNNNINFYKNLIHFVPNGDFIDDFLKYWYNRLDKLEENHDYVQWLFPIREHGKNVKAQRLHAHEIVEIRKDQKCLERLEQAFSLMLNFFGMRRSPQGTIVKNDNWKVQFANLNRNSHNNLRITRILKCLGEFGFESIQKMFLDFLFKEIFLYRTLNCAESCIQFWIGTIKSDQIRAQMYNEVAKFQRIPFREMEFSEEVLKHLFEEERKREAVLDFKFLPHDGETEIIPWPHTATQQVESVIPAMEEKVQVANRNSKVEICVETVESAIAAQEGNASRIELCADLFNGGTTPSYGMVLRVREKVTIPIFVMIRPRIGDFCYSSEDFEIMKYDIEHYSKLGVNGFVFGILLPNGEVDVHRCKILVDLAHKNGIPVTFHRAFDMTKNPFKALEDIISLGIERILTSGQDTSCLEGLDLLVELFKIAKDRIIIVPGGGITERNVKKILDATGAVEFHTSARIEKESEMIHRNGHCFMGTPLRSSEYSLKITTPPRVRGYLEAANKM